MANIKDPAFWHRFSVAVHIDEEASTPITMASPGAAKPTDNWLRHQHKKRRRALCIGFLIVLLVCATAAGIGIVIWWLSQNDMFPWQKDGGSKPAAGGSSSSSSNR
ncbi:MAG: hypothetical protein M4579_002020 [Chaenotheca gracillima]|nr:MAG: hypothetical protein M4579_002020 [Chaenotheca gracillima]